MGPRVAQRGPVLSYNSTCTWTVLWLALDLFIDPLISLIPLWVPKGAQKGPKRGSQKGPKRGPVLSFNSARTWPHLLLALDLFIDSLISYC